MFKVHVILKDRSHVRVIQISKIYDCDGFEKNPIHIITNKHIAFGAS